jgi:hypothetical protein
MRQKNEITFACGAHRCASRADLPDSFDEPPPADRTASKTHVLFWKQLSKMRLMDRFGCNAFCHRFLSIIYSSAAGSPVPLDISVLQRHKPLP